jgi:hypothetical protein
MNDETIAATFERLPEWVNRDTALLHRGRWCATSFLIGAGAVPLYVGIDAGRILHVQRGPALMRSWRFAVRADADAWTRFWQPLPEPGFHDLLAMSRFGRAVIEGDLQPFMANLRYFKEVMEAPRRALAAAGGAKS